MRLPRAATILCLTALTGACTDATAPGPAPPAALLGAWATEADALSPAGWHQYHLTFQANGRFAAEVRSYGLYQGQASGELSAAVRTVGTVRAEGERLTFRPDSQITWDRSRGATPRARLKTPYP